MNSNTLKFANAAIALAALTLLCLFALHLLSPDFDPSWRMVSEYARGKYSWLLSLMFGSWALSTWMLALAIVSANRITHSKAGLIFLAIAGLGEAMASICDIDHPLHDLAGMFGILGLPIGALLVSRNLRGQPTGAKSRNSVRWMANLPWISLLIFVGSMVIMYIQFTRAGGQVSPHVTQLPKGVTGLNGWANRLLILVYCSWTITAARFTSQLQLKEFPYETASI